jgi:ligand-binding sensor domain-containing protein
MTYYEQIHQVIFSILLLVLFVPLDSTAQSSDIFEEHFTIENGLSQNSIYNISQTTDGLLWLGTNDGLNRFDGTQFQIFKPQTIDGISRSSVVYAVAALMDDDLLVGTANSLLVFSTRTQKFYLPHYKYKNFHWPPQAGVNKIFQDKHQRIWILTLDHGVYVYSIPQKQLYPLFQTDEHKLYITDICEDKKGQIYISTEKNIFHIDANYSVEKLTLINGSAFTNIREIIFHNDKLLVCASNQYPTVLKPIAEHTYTLEKSLVQLPKDVTVICQARDKTLWLGSRSNGSFTLDTASATHAYTPQNNASFILDIFEDRENNIWKGHSGYGLVKLIKYPQKFKKIRPSLSYKDKKDDMILSIHSEDDTHYYMGTLASGLLHYNANTKTNRYYENDLTSEEKNIYGMQDDEQYIWIASWAGLLRFDKLSTKYKRFLHGLNKNLYSVLKIPNTEYLIVSGENGTDYFNTKTQQYEKPAFIKSSERQNCIIRHMQIQPNGEIWMATSNRGFVILSPKNGSYKSIPDFDKISTVANHFCVANHTLFIATDKGLIQAHPSKFTIQKLWNDQSGLLNNFIYAVVVDKYNHIWITSNRGISKINQKNFNIIHYDTKDGLQDLEFNTASIKTTKDFSTIYFGGIHGFNSITSDSSYKEVALKIPLITDIKVMNKSFDTDTAFYFLKRLNLSYNQNLIAFEYIVPNPLIKEDIQYKYKLTGVDEDWVDAKERTYASYTQLTPGHYDFLVKAYDKNGNTSPIKALHITIQKAWWQTWWFIVFTTASLIALGFMAIRYHLKQIHKINDINLKLSEFELSSLQESMNPHFIFNILNSISSMVLLQENKGANKYLTKFASYLRNTIEMSQNPHSSIKMNMEQAIRYLEMESLRLPQLSYSVHMHTDINISQSMMPTYLMQPLLENIIWDGGASSRATNIHIEVSPHDDRHIKIDIFVKDPSGSIPHQFNEESAVIQSLYYKLNLMKMKYDSNIEIIVKKQEVMSLHGQCILQIIIENNIKS